jgi:hypothetical protein
MKKLLFVLFVFTMFSCEKAMDDVTPFQTADEDNFRLTEETMNESPILKEGNGDEDTGIVDL